MGRKELADYYKAVQTKSWYGKTQAPEFKRAREAFEILRLTADDLAKVRTCEACAHKHSGRCDEVICSACDKFMIHKTALKKHLIGKTIPCSKTKIGQDQYVSIFGALPSTKDTVDDSVHHLPATNDGIERLMVKGVIMRKKETAPVLIVQKVDGTDMDVDGEQYKAIIADIWKKEEEFKKTLGNNYESVLKPYVEAKGIKYETAPLLITRGGIDIYQYYSAFDSSAPPPNQIVRDGVIYARAPEDADWQRHREWVQVSYPQYADYDPFVFSAYASHRMEMGLHPFISGGEGTGASAFCDCGNETHPHFDNAMRAMVEAYRILREDLFEAEAVRDLVPHYQTVETLIKPESPLDDFSVDLLESVSDISLADTFERITVSEESVLAIRKELEKSIDVMISQVYRGFSGEDTGTFNHLMTDMVSEIHAGNDEEKRNDFYHALTKTISETWQENLIIHHEGLESKANEIVLERMLNRIGRDIIPPSGKTRTAWNTMMGEIGIPVSKVEAPKRKEKRITTTTKKN